MEPKNTDNAHMLVDVLPNLKKRTDLDTLYTDGGHGSPQVDETLTEHQVTQIQTAIRGHTPHPTNCISRSFSAPFLSYFLGEKGGQLRYGQYYDKLAGIICSIFQ